MAKNTQLANLAVNTEADALAALMNGGFIDIYDGTQPATADTAIGAQVKLASLTMANPAFGASVAGVITANPITSDSDADATGTATWARIFKSDHTTVVMDVSVGTATANIIMNSVAIQIHALVAVQSFTHTVAKATSGS